jgi:hypothetical protein
MSSKRIKADPSRFIDIEAVDDGSDTSMENPSDEGTQLIESEL